MPAKSIKFSLRNIIGKSPNPAGNNPSSSGKYNSFNTGEFQNFVFATGGNQTLAPGNGYRYHFFTGTSTFVVEKPGFIDYFVIAGGGGGGSKAPSPTAISAGGGGAGGCRTGVEYFNKGTYTITIGGAGTVGPVPLAGPGGFGGDSSITAPASVGFTTITATGGGGGGGADLVTAKNGTSGGCGGGGGTSGSAGGTGGTGNTPPYTPPQGGDGSVGGDDGAPGAYGGPGGGAGGAGIKDANGIWFVGEAVSAFFDPSIPTSYGSARVPGPRRPNYGINAGPSTRWFAAGGTGGYPFDGRYTSAVNTGHGGPRGGSGSSGIVILRYVFSNGNQIF